MNKKRNRKGFTIVELAIVIAVIAILAAALIPTFSGIIQKAKDRALERALYNEYTEYVIDQDDAASENIYILYGEEYYHITYGKLEVKDDGEIKTYTKDDLDAEIPVWDSETGIVPPTTQP